MTKIKRIANENKIIFNIIDILRIIGGFLFLNAFLSWWFTSSATWGYNGKWLKTEYIKLRITENYRNMTINELSLYNGSNGNLPIYVGVNGKVYDVTASKNIYGPGGSYSGLSGRDAARVFVTGCFKKPDEYTYDLRGLNLDQALLDIKEWQHFFDSSEKYWFVGTVQHNEITGDPPEPCQHLKFPGNH